MQSVEVGREVHQVCRCCKAPVTQTAYIRTYMHAGRQAYTHPQTHAYIHTYMLPNIHTFNKMHEDVRCIKWAFTKEPHAHTYPYRHVCMHTCIHTYIHILHQSVKCIKWASLKSPGRAIEKVLRSYGGDASKLLDVCRCAPIYM
jgi:hypothetical protein